MPVHTAVATSAAGVVSLIPEGLVVLVSLTYAAAAVRMSRRGVLAQQLNAIESLASVDTICIDKTGTLTEATLRVVEVLPAAGVPEERAARRARRRSRRAPQRATSRCRRSRTPSPQSLRPPLGEVPFSSRRRWSAVALRARASCTSARPSACRSGRSRASARGAPATKDGACSRSPTAGGRCRPEAGELPPAGLEPLGLVVLAEELRPGVRETIAFLRREGVEVKVLSGDAPQTVAAIARDVGIPVAGVSDGEAIPDDPVELRRFAARRDGRRADLARGQAGDRARARRSRDAMWRWSATASTTCRR